MSFDAGCEFVPRIEVASLKQPRARLICFYLPQFHSIPENDKWWGEGFTEWVNVRSGVAGFEGHYQPRVPGELGYYNPLDPGVLRRQVELAHLYGIGGFCFYFYWFGGKRLLEAPLRKYLEDASLDLPFCLCWANENWTRRWDGLDQDVLIEQRHSAADDLAFIAHVAAYMRDPRYIRVDGKPLLLVYRPSLLPSGRETAERWRAWCRANGVGEIMLAYVQSFDDADPAVYGFDAAVEFPPIRPPAPDITSCVRDKAGGFEGLVRDWGYFVARSRHYVPVPYRLFRTVCPSWDNSARRKNGATVFTLNSPALYREWLSNAIADAERHNTRPDSKLVFVNAWNEWSEGAYLEPDARFGYAWLAATRQALESDEGFTSAVAPGEPAIGAPSLVMALRGRLAEVDQALAVRDAQWTAQGHAVRERDAEIATLKSLGAAAEFRAARAEHLLAERESEISLHRRQVDQLTLLASQLEQTADLLRQRAERCDAALADCEAHVGQLQQALDEKAARLDMLLLRLARTELALAESHANNDELERRVREGEECIELQVRFLAERESRIAELDRVAADSLVRVAELGHELSVRHGQVLALERVQRAHVRLQTQMANPRFLAGRWLHSMLGRLLPMPGATVAPGGTAESNDGRTPIARDENNAGARNVRCSLIIPTFNGGALFSEVVEALRCQTCWPQVEFIVVDSGSSDGTTDVAREAGARVVSIVQQQFNHGSSRDYGISLAASERIILLVQDAVPDRNDAFERLLRVLEEPGVAGVYARQVARPDADVITRRNLEQWLTGRGARESRAISDLNVYEAMAPLEKFRFCNFDNVCSALNRSVWEQERFGAVNFGEDIDWAERVLRRGFRIVYEPAATVVHSHDRSLGYEYRRTYVCHRKLFRQFGVHLVQTRRGLINAWLRSSRTDLAYVLRHQRPFLRMLRVAALVPLQNFLGALAQYRAVRDEMRGRALEVGGV